MYNILTFGDSTMTCFVSFSMCCAYFFVIAPILLYHRRHDYIIDISKRKWFLCIFVSCVYLKSTQLSCSPWRKLVLNHVMMITHHYYVFESIYRTTIYQKLYTCTIQNTHKWNFPPCAHFHPWYFVIFSLCYCLARIFLLSIAYRIAFAPLPPYHHHTRNYN